MYVKLNQSFLKSTDKRKILKLQFHLIFIQIGVL